VQVHVREQCKTPCPYVHCHAHCLKLVLFTEYNSNPRVVNALGLMEGIYSFIHASTVRHDLFTQCQHNDCNVNWTCWRFAVSVYLMNHAQPARMRRHGRPQLTMRRPGRPQLTSRSTAIYVECQVMCAKPFCFIMFLCRICTRSTPV